MKLDSLERVERTVVSPEGVALQFELASIPDRVTAFAIDFVLSHLGAVLLLILGLVGGGTAVGIPLGLISSFLLRNFYFAFFEIRWGGATPGKRRYHLRVISREGGPVTAEATFARNLTRDIEVFYPAIALWFPKAIVGDMPDWAAAVAVLWLILLGALPLLSRDRLRIGDMLGGTLVVRMPETKLEPDLAARPATDTGDERQPAFTREQLDLYGIKELQILEEFLRKNRTNRDRKLLKEAARRIRKKIGWSGEEDWTDWQFLNAFYGAQRGRLERKLLFGKRQNEKRN